MSKDSPLLSSLLVTFLVIGSPLTSAHDIPIGEISLVRQPEENYYLVKKIPAVIICQAKNAAEIIFTCMGTQIPETSVEVEDVSDIDPGLIQAKIEVTRADVQNHENGAPFWCTCSAVDVDGQVAVTSRKGYVSVSYLHNKFSTQPSDTTATVGENVEFTCGAPEGQPKPEIMWRKDKKRLEVDSNPRLIITDMGSLVIKSATTDDSGLFQCVARNVAGRRESESAQLTVVALEESSEPEMGLSEEDEASKKTAGFGKPRATRQTLKTYFTMEPQEKHYVTQDKPLLINCGVVAADILTFRCNGKRMDRERQTISQGLDSSGNRNIQSQLRITYADVQAFQEESGGNGTFQCICAAWFQDSGSPNGWGRLDSSGRLGFVFPAYLDDAFQSEPSDVTAGLKTDVTIVCEPPKGEPSPWVYWYKDGSRLDLRSSNKYTMNGKGHLVIHNVQYEDAGMYSCVAENSIKSVQSRVGRLTVTAGDPSTTTAVIPGEDYFPDFPEVIPSTPVFLRDFQPEYSLDRDGTKALTCAVVSADQITVDCGGKRLAAEDYELKSKVDRETGKRLLSAMTVVNAEKVAQNPDNYFCQCTAWYLNEQKSWSKVLSARGYIRQAAKSAYIGDQFAVTPEDTDAIYQAAVELVCKPPDGSPPPTLYWLKDGIRIDSLADPTFTIMDDGTLVIDYARASDEGEYTCVAENEAGTRSSNPVQLRVHGKPEQTSSKTEPDTTTHTSERTTVYDADATTFMLAQPIFTLAPNPENYIIRDQPVNLSCIVFAAKVLLIACNGKHVPETALTAFRPYDPENQLSTSLVITKEEVEAHTGSEPYTCVCRAFYQEKYIESEETKNVNSTPAVIQIAYLRNHFLQEPTDTQVTYLGKAELFCKAPNGNPKPEVYWLKDGFRVLQNERIRVEGSGNLVIDKFTEQDVGAYTCVAENLVRSRTSQAAIVTLFAVSVESVTKPDITPTTPTSETTSEAETTLPEQHVEIYPGTPYISKDIHTVYYLVKNKPVTIVCEAYGVEFITFTCGMQKVEDQEIRERMEAHVLPDGRSEMVKVTEATINVSQNEIENYETGNEYYCQCHAHYRVSGSEDYQELISTKSVVEIAYLDEYFEKEPEGQTVREGETLAILCQPPDGNPKPKVSWLKDGESFEDLQIAPHLGLIFPEAQLEHTGEYICVAENEAGRRTSSPVLIEVKEKEVSLTDIEDNEGSVCAQTLTDCTIGLPHGVDDLEFCRALPEYSACIESYIEKCTGVVSEDSLRAVKLAYTHTRNKCSLQPRCPELESCKRISSNSPTSGLTVQNFCLGGNTLLHCVDQALKDCNVTLSPSEEEVKSNLFEVVSWFTDFCQGMILGSQSLASCDQMMTCDLYIGQLAANNSTSWCRLMNTLVECTNEAISTCELDELRSELEQLHSQTRYITCAEDDIEGKHTGPWQEITPEPEGEVEPKGDDKTEPSGETKAESIESSYDGTEGDEDDFDDGGNNESIEGGAAASKDGSDNGSTVLCTSTYLVTILQLVTVAVLSLR